MQHSLGAYLRELRVAKGLSLEAVARASRVGEGYLDALERDALDELPAPVFTKGFIRAYCQILGAPPDEALARYQKLSSESEPQPPAPAQIQPLRREPRARGPVLVSLVLLLAFGLSLLIVTLVLQRRAPRITGPAGPAAPLAAPPALAPIAPAGPGAPTQGLADAGEGQRNRLVARATEPTWISVRTDDGRVFQELLPAGATREWVSPKRFVLSIGNAGGISLELNGQALPPLGARGAVIREIVIPREAESQRP